jgi:hypothetical protein
LDATLEEENGIEGGKVIRSILRTGYHRTPLEIEKKNTGAIYSSGILLRYTSDHRNLTLGINGIWNKLSRPVREIPRYYNRYDFSGNQQLSLGINYNYYRGKFCAFGEVAYIHHAGIGLVHGLIANLSSSVETTIHLRYYGRQYYSLTGRAFGEYSMNNNEQGIYWGIKIMPVARVQLHFFFDLFRSDWLRNGMASPGAGYEWMAYIKYSIGHYSGMDLTFQAEHKGKNHPVGNLTEYTVSTGIRRKIRLNYQYGAERGLQIRSRIQGTQYCFRNNSYLGGAIIQDLGYKFSWGYLKSSASFFHTEDHMTRQYVYEPDVLFYFSVPAYYGRGLRYFILLKVKPLRSMECWLKFGQYHYFHQTTIGDGLEEIQGNKKTEIRCQIRFKF